MDSSELDYAGDFERLLFGYLYHRNQANVIGRDVQLMMQNRGPYSIALHEADAFARDLGRYLQANELDHGAPRVVGAFKIGIEIQGGLSQFRTAGVVGLDE